MGDHPLTHLRVDRHRVTDAARRNRPRRRPASDGQAAEALHKLAALSDGSSATPPDPAVLAAELRSAGITVSPT